MLLEWALERKGRAPAVAKAWANPFQITLWFLPEVGGRVSSSVLVLDDEESLPPMRVVVEVIGARLSAIRGGMNADMDDAQWMTEVVCPAMSCDR